MVEPRPLPLSARSGDRTLADADHVAGRVLEPGPASRADGCDEVDRLGRLVLLECHPARGQVGHHRIDVVDLKMGHGLAHVWLALANAELGAMAGPDPNR